MKISLPFFVEMIRWSIKIYIVEVGLSLTYDR